MKRTVLITGASRGIGASLAKAFAAAGYGYVGINYNAGADSAREVQAACEAAGAQAGIFQADVSARDECARLLEQFIARAGRIDALINNAGGALKLPAGGFEAMPLDYFDSQIRLNLCAAAYCSHYAIRDMLNNKIPGRIVNISSIHGDITWVRRKMLPYSAAKGGLNMLTRALGVEMAPHGIGVNGIAPGFISTQATTRYTEAEKTLFIRKIPAGFLGEADDLAPLALLLADPAQSRFIVGQTFTVDGGQSIDGAIDGMLDQGF